MNDMLEFATECSRYYFVHWWYAKLVKAGGRLDPPYYEGPPIIVVNASHDAAVARNLLAWEKRGRKRLGD